MRLRLTMLDDGASRIISGDGLDQMAVAGK
jgi:hypothetical protein